MREEAPKGAQGVHKEPEGNPSKAPRRLKKAKGSPKEDQERPKGDPKEGEERHKRRPGGPKGAQGRLERLTFGGSQASKKQENQKRDFSKTELSFESGAHSERGAASPKAAQRRPK